MNIALGIDKIATRESKEYYGSITASDLDVFTEDDGTIPFKITVMKGDEGETHRYDFLLKKKDYTAVRGKVKATLIERIETELDKMKLQLI